MNGESGGEQGLPRGYSRDDRLPQLAGLAEACAGAGDLFRQHGPQDWGRAYGSVAAKARRLMVEDFGDVDLRELAVSVPEADPPTYRRPGGKAVTTAG